ncbi:MAG: amidohydrolase family protein [Bryobacterales bacterium]|nr:amidohydrolase family protein [Bryobacterales bacterium]
MNRRAFSLTSAVGALPLMAQQTRKGTPLDLQDYRPKSMLNVPETAVEKARFPVIDFHTHLTWEKAATPEQLLQVMDRRNIRTLVNVTGGFGDKLRQAIAKFDRAHSGRFLTFTEPAWKRANEPGYARMQADMVGEAKRDGARGLKVLKTLGLFLRDSAGKLVTVDDPRFDPMWDACGQLNLPVAIHVSDPAAFFKPVDRFNERFEELNNHPDWSFHGKDFPSNEQILAARDRVFARHPKTTFVALHGGNFSEDLGHVGRALDRFPNMHVDIAARIGEFGRQPYTSGKFFDKYQDRILFGTDATPNGVEYPQQLYGDLLYQIYYRFLETSDEYFDYAPAAVPPQGRWRIYGIGLSESVLRKVYHGNAARILSFQV